MFANFPGDNVQATVSASWAFEQGHKSAFILYSPDSQWIYFQPNHLNIYRMPADGGEPQAITNYPTDSMPSWRCCT